MQNPAALQDGLLSTRPFIIPIFIPHAGCPHRCVFCNQWVVSGQLETPQEPEDGLASVREFLRFRGHRLGPAQIAFFGGNFLGLPHERLRRLLDAASRWVCNARLDGIRFSTRPDTVRSEVLDLIGAYPVKCVELGVQSMDDEVLRQSRRGHSAADTVAAVQQLKDRGYDAGVQLMVGLPGDEEASLLETGRRVSDLCPAFVRIYPTLVLEGSLLAGWFRAGRYRPPSLEEAVDLSMKLYRFLRQRRIPVIRTGLQPTRDLVDGRGVIAGPFHPAFGEIVQSACFLDAVRRELRCRPFLGNALELRVHPLDTSRARGQRNTNGAALRREFGFSAVFVTPDASLDEETVALPDGRVINVYKESALRPAARRFL
jgi:histone acetyltransferase (RNA polymerase elongator complex component)